MWVELHIKYLGREMGGWRGNGRKGRGSRKKRKEEEEGMEKVRRKERRRKRNEKKGGGERWDGEGTRMERAWEEGGEKEGRGDQMKQGGGGTKSKVQTKKPQHYY